MITRRLFFTHGPALAAAVGAMPRSLLRGLSPEGALGMFDTFTLSTFQPLVNTVFRFQVGSLSAIPLELIEARACTPTGAQVTPQNAENHFSLLFRGPAHQALAQETYRVDHRELGGFDLFIVPIGKDPQGFRYQAVYNRVVPPTA